MENDEGIIVKKSDDSLDRIKFFKLQRDIYLQKAKAELINLKLLFDLDSDSENVSVQKEASIYIISVLLRKCHELELIKLNNVDKNKLNRFIHCHIRITAKDGSLLVQSERGLKQNDKLLVFDSDWVDKTIRQIEVHNSKDLDPSKFNSVHFK